MFFIERTLSNYRSITECDEHIPYSSFVTKEKLSISKKNTSGNLRVVLQNQYVMHIYIV